MELKSTVELMNSDNYQERFKAEYFQTKIRYDKLSAMIAKLQAGTLGFEPKCTQALLEDQLYYMNEYLKLLRVRAEIEGIDLKESERIKLTDETGYILISEIIKAHTAEHNQDREVMQRCEQALQILNMMKED